MSRRLLVLVLLCVTATARGHLEMSAQERPSMSTRNATGTFTVTMRPPAEGGTPGRFLLLRIDKTFEGGLIGTSEVEMLASNAGDQPSGGYVALERFTGTLDGRRGSFVLQHSGTMSPGVMRIDVQVTPGSGTEALAGLEGRLTITMDGKRHQYDLTYTLPDQVPEAGAAGAGPPAPPAGL